MYERKFACFFCTYSSAANDYERTETTETVYLAGLGRAIYAPGLPGPALHAVGF